MMKTKDQLKQEIQEAFDLMCEQISLGLIDDVYMLIKYKEGHTTQMRRSTDEWVIRCSIDREMPQCMEDVLRGFREGVKGAYEGVCKGIDEELIKTVHMYATPARVICRHAWKVE
jgi:hypothetical protein